jgi:hypothetical protein
MHFVYRSYPDRRAWNSTELPHYTTVMSPGRQNGNTTPYRIVTVPVESNQALPFPGEGIPCLPMMMKGGLLSPYRCMTHYVV